MWFDNKEEDDDDDDDIDTDHNQCDVDNDHEQCDRITTRILIQIMIMIQQYQSQRCDMSMMI